MPIKITLIGAGSVVFAKTLVGDILRFPELSDATICLVDIDASRLKIAEVMMNHIVNQLKVPARIEATLCQRGGIRNSKYVICTIQVGGYKPSTIHDFEIPKQYGLRQTIADTLGVGGVFRGLRTIPVINSIARDIADVAHSDCLLINYTNPMAMICRAVDLAVGIPHVGLCHSVFGTANQLCRFANLPAEDVSYFVAGINHMAFFLKFQYQGRDAYPLLFKALEDPQRTHELVRFEMMRRTGYFVTESSEHQSEYLPYFIHHGKETIEQFKIPLDEYMRRCEAITSSWKETEARLMGKDGVIELAPQSHEYGSYIIHSIESGQARTVYGNVPNCNIIKNLPEHCCVEVPCLVDRTGLHPVWVGTLPPQLAALCQTNINVQELAVQAALTGKREHIYHAVMMDPNTASSLTLDRIWSMCDELIEAHQKDGYLGRFKPVVKSTGRGFAGIGDQLIARLDSQSAFATADGSTNSLVLEVENLTGEAATIQFQLKPEDSRLSVVEGESLTVTVAGGSCMTREVKVINRSTINQVYRVNLSADDSQVLAIGAILRPRQALQLNDEGAASFSVQLAGFEACHGTIRIEQEQLKAYLKVLDSNPKPIPLRPHMGSCVLLFFAEPERSSNILEVAFVPGCHNGKARLECKQRALIGEWVEYKRTKMYYEAWLTIPLASLGLRTNLQSLLFDCIGNINALGEAHSGGKFNLGGKFSSANESGHFSWVSWTKGE